MPRKEDDPRKFGIRKLSMLLFGLVLLAIVGCGSFMAVHFNDPQWFSYSCGSVFTSFILIAIFGWPIDD